LVACRETVPDVWDLVRGVEESLRELQKAAEPAKAAKKPGFLSRLLERAHRPL